MPDRMPVLAAMTPHDIAQAVTRMHARIDTIRSQLNAADRVLGDGDTGMTVASVVGAWSVELAEPPADVGAALQQLGRATRRVTGSSLGSVFGIGLTAAGKSGHADPPALLDAAIAAISARSGATPGDKTILDSLIAIRDAAPGTTALDAARAALDAFRGREARLGRARIYGERSAGHDDPGMLAVLLLLQAMLG